MPFRPLVIKPSTPKTVDNLLKSALNKASPKISPENMKPILKGVLEKKNPLRKRVLQHQQLTPTRPIQL